MVHSIATQIRQDEYRMKRGEIKICRVHCECVGGHDIDRCASYCCFVHARLETHKCQ